MHSTLACILLCSQGFPGTLSILLPQIPECWGSRDTLPCQDLLIFLELFANILQLLYTSHINISTCISGWQRYQCVCVSMGIHTQHLCTHARMNGSQSQDFRYPLVLLSCSLLYSLETVFSEPGVCYFWLDQLLAHELPGSTCPWPIPLEICIHVPMLAQ